MKVKLGVILDAIEMADDNYTYFLDLETGKSVFLADELITGLDNEGLEDEIEENPERYLRLPTKFEIHEYHIMEEFIWTLKVKGRINWNVPYGGGERSGDLRIW